MNYEYKNHPPLGAHTSISGGVFNAIYNGAEIGCDVVQLFSKNQMQWKVNRLPRETVDRFNRAVEETGVFPATIHDSYLINLASTNKFIQKKSYLNFVKELIRCEQLGVPYLVMHPGSHLGAGEEAGMNKIAGNINNAYEEAGVKKMVVLLEQTAGQGTNLGYSFEQLKYMINKCSLAKNVGVCLDTCHLFAAGYDLRNASTWKKTKKRFDDVIGLSKLKAIHINDSKRELGSRVDRHARVGHGEIGLEGFRAILNDPDLRDIPMIMEIPGGNEAYRKDLEVLRNLLESKKAS